MKKDPNDQPPPWQGIADKVANDADADIFFYSGAMEFPSDFQLITLVEKTAERSKNVILMLTTFGGSADSAYRIIRCLQRVYADGKITLFVDTMCKSAGTLIALGADEIVVGDLGELGPLDVQVSKSDEVGEFSSGLTPSQTFSALQLEAFNLFHETFRKLRKEKFPTKIATSTAARIVSGLFRPIYAQVDPMRLGETERSLMIAKRYGERVSGNSDNVKDDTIDILLTRYPTHGFVIDRKEAAELFSQVRCPTDDERRLARSLRPVAMEGLRRSNVDEDSEPIIFPIASKTTPQPNPSSASQDGKQSHENSQKPGMASPAGSEGGNGTSGNDVKGVADFAPQNPGADNGPDCATASKKDNDSMQAAVGDKADDAEVVALHGTESHRF